MKHDRERILKGLERHATTKYISTHEACPYKDIDICHHVLAEEAYKYISEQPQIVRCKDCAHLNRDPRFMNYGYCSYFKDKFYANVKPDKNFYCGAGKRQQ